MIDIGKSKSINPAYVVSVEIDRRHYMNGSDSWILITMADGSKLVRQHGYGIDIYAIKEAIEKGQQ